ncbi:HlyC/CorC family transporter [Yunchengibacter salinarum]|uniref:HlyC/CorC family transporter n=1 Tax=Yunchengibacter salinarum TaxID=3133399 RepID=UPI0035B5E292
MTDDTPPALPAALAPPDMVDLWLTGLAILVLLVLSGIFSGSETALTAASKARIHQLAKTGRKSAKRVSRLIEDKERLLGAILLGNNLVNILASALATSLLITLVGDEGVVYATLLMTALVLIFAEVLPKSYAIANPDRMALTVSAFIAAMVWLFSPVVAIVRQVVRFTLRLAGTDISRLESVLTPQEEIRSTIDLQSAEGGIVREDRHMLGSILELDEVTVEDVMVHRKSMQALNLSARPADIVAAVVRSPHTRLPLYDGENENIVGILHAKDVLRALRRSGWQMDRFDPRTVMKDPWFVPETTSLREQLDAFLERHSHFALVVNEYGDIQGLVTLEDILEEIVGEIADEHDYEVEGARILPDGTVQAEGTVPIRDLNRMLDWDLPDDAATTIAGLVIFEAEAIPIVGQSFSFHGYRFHITARKRNQITGVRVQKEKPAE